MHGEIHMLDRWFMSGTIQNNSLYWITEIGGHIMKMDLDKYNIEYIQIDGLSAEENLAQSCIFYQEEDTIYAFINNGQKLLLYNHIKHTYRLLKLGLEKKNLSMFAEVAKRGDELIIVPIYSNDIVRINITTGEIECQKVICETEKMEDDIAPYFAKFDEKIDDVMWLFSSRTLEVFQYNFYTGKKKDYKLPVEIGSPIDVVRYRGNFLILTQQGDIYSWNIKQNNIENIMGLKQERNNVFSKICIASDKLWILPFHGKDILVYDLKNKFISKFEQYPHDFKYDAPSCMSKYTYAIQDESKYYFAMHASNYILRVNKDTGEGNWINAKWPEKEADIECLLSEEKLVFQELEMDFATYLEFVEREKKEKKVEECENGRKIWKECKSM